MTRLRLLLGALLVAGPATWGTASAAEGGRGTLTDAVRRGFPADTDTVAARDTSRVQEAPVLADTLERPDTVARDTARLELEARRQALSREGFPSRDSVFQQLSRLAGYRAVEYRGEAVELDLEREAVELRGEAQANYTESVLEADSIAYLVDLQFMRAGGNIRLLGEGNREVTSDATLHYDISRTKGTIMDARTVFAERGTQWFVLGTATPKGASTVYVERGSFTSCDLEEPHYYFKGGKIKAVSEDYIAAWPIVLYVHGVPIAWLPFFAQDIRPGRRSGFLPPQFGFNDIVQTGGTRRSVSDFGYYFALNPYMDARFTVDWLSGDYTRLNGAYNYRVLKDFFQGGVLTRYSFGERGRVFDVVARHNHRLAPGTDFRMNAQFINDIRLFEDRTFDPREQTQDITTDVGFNHRFPFATLQFSGRRQQQAGAQRGQTILTLPSLNMSFSPVTFFRAPAFRAGPFNNLVWSGSANFSRVDESFETRDDRTTTRGAVTPNLRLGRFTVSSSASFNDVRTVPFDSVGPPPDPFSRTTINWSSLGNYQVDLMGSTTLRPTFRVDGGAFRSPDTGGGFISTPTRLNVGATLSTDLYTFLPGFGPFTRIRHKVSPGFSYNYSPAVTVADSILEIPGFPARSGREQNTLAVTFRQTFEAKVRPRREPGEPEAPEAPEGPPVEEWPEPGAPEAPETPEGPPVEEWPEPGVPEEVPEQAAVPGEEAQEVAAPAQERVAPPGAPRRPLPERSIVLLAINSSPLVFDFAGENEPALVTDRWTHNISSDLLRGFSINMTLDLFEGVGEDRSFKPFLAAITGGFRIDSRTGLAGLLGLAEPRPLPPRPLRRHPADPGYDRFPFGEDQEEPFDATRGGPWDLSLTYSLQRVRPGELGRMSQNLGGVLGFHPTPNWRVRWNTQYNVTDREFSSNAISLQRDLHDWEASFRFSKLPNGNVHFSVMVSLKAAPELRVNYDQQTQTAR